MLKEYVQLNFVGPYNVWCAHVTDSPNQALENQELACENGILDSNLICVSGLVLPASLPNFWPRFLLWAYLSGPSTNIISALIQIHCLYLFQLTRVSCFGLSMKPSVWPRPPWRRAHKRALWAPRGHLTLLSARKLGGPSRISFMDSSIHHAAPSKSSGRKQVQTWAGVEPRKLPWLVRGLACSSDCDYPIRRPGQAWSKWIGKRTCMHVQTR